MSVRVATFNTRHGAREDDHVDHRSLVQTCAELEADILGLQEVESRHRRTWFRNQAALVARRLGCEFVYGTVIRSGLGRYGNALWHADRSATSRSSRSPARVSGSPAARSSRASNSRRSRSPWRSPTCNTNRRTCGTFPPKPRCSCVDCSTDWQLVPARASCSAISTSALRAPCRSSPTPVLRRSRRRRPFLPVRPE